MDIIEPSASASGVRWGYNGGTFLESEYEAARRDGKPLTLDISAHSGCSNNCIYCGYLNTQGGTPLTGGEIANMIRQFSGLGGKSFRFVGEGEPLSRKDIFQLVGEIKKSGMIPVIFSCGDLLGDDGLCLKLHGFDGREAIGRLDEAGVTVVLKYDAHHQDHIVKRPGYSEKRNLALERLMNAGFNLHAPSHLAFGTVVLRANHKEIPELYDYGLSRNIYTVNCALMPIGRSEFDYPRLGITGDEMIELAAKTHIIAWEYGIPFTRVADFPGGLQCDVSRAGFYVSYTGKIDLCEANIFEDIGNFRDVPLSVAWERINAARERQGDERVRGLCIAKRAKGIIPQNYDAEVARKVNDFIRKHPGRFNSRARAVTKAMLKPG